jgi:hypothetical protein
MVQLQGALRTRTVGLVLWLAFAGWPALSSGVAATDVQPYRLGSQSRYLEGCFPPCLCPLRYAGPLSGSFTLRLLARGEDYTSYSVGDVDWSLPPAAGLPQAIAGSGDYIVGTADDPTQEMTLSLSLDGGASARYASGSAPVDAVFPALHVSVSGHGMRCYDTVFDIYAEPVPPSPTPPVKRTLVIDPQQSTVTFSLLSGGADSVLSGTVRVYLGDPDVAVIALPGMVGLSVESADLIAVHLQPDSPTLPDSLHMLLDPERPSIGSWNRETGQVAFTLYLTTADGGLPVPQPLSISGRLRDGVLEVRGDNGDVADAGMALALTAFERLVPPGQLVWFSTNLGFTSKGRAATSVTSGDLLNVEGDVVASNRELVGHLGIMPIVPPLGLDAVMNGLFGALWFSFEGQAGTQWSETLGRFLSPGDLLSNSGCVVLDQARMLAPFSPSADTGNIGLDAVAWGGRDGLLFSTSRGFYSGALRAPIGDGDLLSWRGKRLLTNRELLRELDVVDMAASPLPSDYGLDALVRRPYGEFWFSTTRGFYVRDRLQPERTSWISDGDLLSSFGYVVARNLDLVGAFAPLEKVADFGLDSVHVHHSGPLRPEATNQLFIGPTGHSTADR